MSLETELRLIGQSALFVVHTDEPDFRRALGKLGFTEDNQAFVRAFPAGAPGLHECYFRFKRTLEDMLAQAAGRLITPWEDALDAAATRLRSNHADWFLAGGGALAVRGIEVVPRVLDLVVADEATATAALGDAQIEPTSENRPGTWISRWFGRAFLNARIEWISDVDPAIDVYAAPNDHGPAAAARLEHVRWHDHDLALAPLELQLAVAEKRGLTERAAAIRDFRG
ncbi:MAG TPA: hypothetical protein VLJ76_01370 [Gaiellaceae bacterium]|nr:hypothetical protein [Gaiellaceae bacterium]